MNRLSDEELVAKVDKWNGKLCQTGGRAWSLNVPAEPDNDPDLLIAELCKRFEQANQELLTLRQRTRWVNVFRRNLNVGYWEVLGKEFNTKQEAEEYGRVNLDHLRVIQIIQ